MHALLVIEYFYIVDQVFLLHESEYAFHQWLHIKVQSDEWWNTS